MRRDLEAPGRLLDVEQRIHTQSDILLHDGCMKRSAKAPKPGEGTESASSETSPGAKPCEILHRLTQSAGRLGVQVVAGPSPVAPTRSIRELAFGLTPPLLFRLPPG